MSDRRQFLAGLGALLLLPALRQDADPLRDPIAAGRSRRPVTDYTNDETIKAIEKQLKCTCGCNLDIYTCRTTDFTCTYSPQLHEEIVALSQQGLSPEQVIAAFVERHGVASLMAPPARGFNLMGYLVPGTAVLAAASILALVLLRRHRRIEAAPVPAGPAPDARAPGELSAEERETLERALSEVAD